MADRPYYEAYDQRYRAVHRTGEPWFSPTPTPVLGEVLARYGIGRDAPMLELGCGEGRDAGPLLSAGYDLLATDVSPAAVTWCRKRWPEHAERFAVLDAVRGSLDRRFSFLFAVAVVHMLVEDADRAGFYRFIREHLAEGGLALLCFMGDGIGERRTDAADAFALRERERGGRTVSVAATSCRTVRWETWERELADSGLVIRERGMTSVPGEFSDLMYTVTEAG